MGNAQSESAPNAYYRFTVVTQITPSPGLLVNDIRKKVPHFPPDILQTLRTKLPSAAGRTRIMIEEVSTRDHPRWAFNRVIAVLKEGIGIPEFYAEINSKGNIVEAKSLSSRAFNRPVNSNRITSGFGYRQNPLTGRYSLHAGLDIGVAVGTPVHTVAPGIVSRVVFNDRLAGNFIVIDHGNDFESRYLHLSEIVVKEQQQISAGQVIGLSGNTGRSTGPHLHYEILHKSLPQDPRLLINATSTLRIEERPLNKLLKECSLENDVITVCTDKRHLFTSPYLAEHDE